MKAILALAFVIITCPAYAQGLGPDNAIRDVLRAESAHVRTGVDWATTGAVAVSLALPCLRDRTMLCVKNEALQVGSAALTAELTKLFVHRTRPNGLNKKSFFSEHTILACVTTLRTKYWEVCPAVAVGRIISDEHWASDTMVGAAGGGLFTTLHWGK